MAGEIAGTAAQKAALRKQILAARDAQNAATRAAASAAITRELLALDAWRNARCVLVYLNFGSEFDTTALVADAVAGGKQLCLPRVEQAAHALAIHAINNLATDIQPGVWGIREPRPACPLTDLASIDFVLVPGVAFTPRCERLGYGGGFYDALIARFAQRPPLVAAAFDLQICGQIPLDVRDHALDLIVTESTAHCGC